MEDRLLKLLDTEQLSSSKFADVIGVQRSSVSHILTGRNKPSFDFLQKTLQAFPMLNADWLILGEGEMYEGERGSGGGSLFDQPEGMTAEAGPAVTSGADVPSAAPVASTLAEADHSASSTEDNGISEDSGDELRDQGQQATVHQAGASQRNADLQRPVHQSPGQQNPDPQPAGAFRAAEPGMRERRVIRVILFYDDNSFATYENA